MILPFLGGPIVAQVPVLRIITVTDCTTQTGKEGQFCFDNDAATDQLYVCEPTAGDCDTAGEWTQIVGSGGGGTKIEDGDTDTYVDVEQGADDDVVRIGAWTGVATKEFELYGTAGAFRFDVDDQMEFRVSDDSAFVFRHNFATTASTSLQVAPTLFRYQQGTTAKLDLNPNFALFNYSGTAGAPAVASWVDPNTGFYWPAADQFGLSAGGQDGITMVEAASAIAGTLHDEWSVTGGFSVTDDIAVTTSAALDTVFSVEAGANDFSIRNRTDKNGFDLIYGATNFCISDATNDGVRVGSCNDSTYSGLVRATPSATVPNVVPSWIDIDTGVGRQAEDALSLVAGGVEGVRVTESAGAVVVKADGAYGELVEDNAGGSTITVVTAATYYGWVTAGAGEANGVSSDVADANADHLTIDSGSGGDYLISISMSFSGTANAVMKCFLHDSAVKTNIGFTRTLSAAGATGSASGSGIYAAADADELNIRCTSDGNGDTLTVYQVNLAIHRVGG
jgi:hypothetical protein